MTFSDVSFESNIGMMMEAGTAVAGDYDNDGDFDVFIGASIGSSVFFRIMAMVHSKYYLTSWNKC